MIVSKTWFFINVASRDRFLERAFPLQSDRPSQATFQNLIDTFAEEVVVQALSVRVTSVESRLTILEALMPTKADITYVDSQLALKADESDLVILEGRVDALDLQVIDLENTKADTTWVQNNYPEQTEFDNAITNLQNTKLNVTTYNQWKNNVVEPRLNVEHINWNPTKSDDSYFIPFINTSKIVINNVQTSGIIEWNIYAVNGNNILYSETLSSFTIGSAVLPRDFKANNINVDGIVLVAKTIQGGLPQYIKPSMNIRVEYVY